ncbi:MAG: histidine kinase [Chitinophagaceae bacterium]
MRKTWLIFFILQFVANVLSYSQAHKPLFYCFNDPEIPYNKFEEILVSKKGPVFISASEFSFALVTGGNLGAFTIGLDNMNYGIKGIESAFSGAPIKALAESSEGVIFFSTAKNQITYFNSDLEGICDIPPFYFPVKGDSPKNITRLWFDKVNNLYIGVTDEEFYIVPHAGLTKSLDPKNYRISNTKDSSMLINKGELPVKKISVGQSRGVFSFTENKTSKNIVWLGTGNGLFSYNNVNGELKKILSNRDSLTVTHIEALPNGDIWFSTLEKGLGVYHQLAGTYEFYPYPKNRQEPGILYPVQDFCVKSPADFFVAIRDSLPAIFNINEKKYKFIDDTAFTASKNSSTDIRIDSTGTIYLIKGGLLYTAHLADNPDWGFDSSKINYTPIIYGVTDFNKKEITNYLTDPELLKKLNLSYDQNSIIIYFTSNSYSKNKKTQYAWTLEGDFKTWVEMPVYSPDNDSSNIASLPDIKPGKYIFRVKVRVGEGEWSPHEASMELIITPPYWATWWFWTAIIVSLLLLIYTVVKLRVRAVRKTERLKARYEKELLELEAKALRAQMNPHFVFNCLNSIKALMQENQNEKGITYLTTFSKLIRTLFNNADKKQISLYDEIETCKFYLQLEAMRFDTKLSYSVNVDENIDLKSVLIPALIVQPFIENAIWHGIVPRNTGGKVSLNVLKNNGNLEIVIEDDGIGRDASRQNKSASALTHHSKGVNLTKSRLELDNLLQQRQARLDIFDRKDEAGKATGTKVIITLKQEI